MVMHSTTRVEAHPSGAPSVAQWGRRGPAAQTVVIADDEPHIRRLLRITLEADGCRILEAADGDAAWRLIETERPVVVLLDVKMPGRNGLQVAERIKTEPALRGITVIMLTASSSPADVEAGRLAGADYYLIKPFSPLELLEAVERALDASRQMLEHYD